MNVVDTLGLNLSTCSRRQYGAIILSTDGRVIGVGYNGSAPKDGHCNEGACPRALTTVPHGSQYDNCIAIHAEANAIMWSDKSLRNGSTLIVNGPPCYSCAKLIASSGITKVVCRYDSSYEKFDEVCNYFMNLNIEMEIIE